MPPSYDSITFERKDTRKLLLPLPPVLPPTRSHSLDSRQRFAHTPSTSRTPVHARTPAADKANAPMLTPRSQERHRARALALARSSGLCAHSAHGPARIEARPSDPPHAHAHGRAIATIPRAGPRLRRDKSHRAATRKTDARSASCESDLTREKEASELAAEKEGSPSTRPDRGCAGAGADSRGAVGACPLGRGTGQPYCLISLSQT
jgi:hypothetical protein